MSKELEAIQKRALAGAVTIYGGMHYRTSGVHGTVIANNGAHYVAKHYFQPVE